MCLVHGLGEHSGRYAHVAAALAQAGYATFTFDLRGHGKSQGPRGHAPSYAAIYDDIDCLLDQAGLHYPHIQRFLYGHSLGGNIVLNFVLERRPKLGGVIASSPILRPAEAPPRWKTTLGRLLYRMRPAMLFSNGLDRAGLSHDPAIIRAYSADPLVHDRVSARLGTEMLAKGEQMVEQAARFPLPLLLMHGNSDPLTSCLASRAFAARVPAGRCTYVEWDGLYHELHNETRRDEVLRTVVDWLDKRMAIRPVPAEPVGHSAESGHANRSKRRR